MVVLLSRKSLLEVRSTRCVRNEPRWSSLNAAVIGATAYRFGRRKFGTCPIAAAA